ncbi:MAG: MarR family winged helix-turn-helix transcriptional regulator [Bacteroidota bacterium]
MRLEDEIYQKEFKSGYHKAVVNIIYTCNWILNHQERILKPAGLTPQQYNILRILRGQYPNPSSIKLIRERMLDKMSDASRLVEKLRIKGLVERTECSQDRRKVDILITQKGLDILKKLDKGSDRINTLLSGLNEKEIAQLNRLLDDLRG